MKECRVTLRSGGFFPSFTANGRINIYSIILEMYVCALFFVDELCNKLG